MGQNRVAEPTAEGQAEVKPAASQEKNSGKENSEGGFDNREGESLTFGGSHTFSADLEDSRGDVSVTRAMAELDIQRRLGEKLSWNLAVTNEWSWYDFGKGDNAVVNGSEKPLSQVTDVRISPGVSYKVDEKWSWFGSVTLAGSGETDADVGQSLTYGGVAGVRYRASDKVTYTFGLAGTTRLEDNGIVLPVLAIEWAFAEDWRLSARGPEVRVAWQPEQEWTFSAVASYESRDFRLAKRGALPEGVLRDQRVTVGLEAEWSPREWIVAKVGGGVVPWSQLEFDNRDGHTVDSLTVDPTGYLGGSIEIDF